MRQFIEMTTHTDKGVESVYLTLTQARKDLSEFCRSLNLIEGPTNATRAYRDIMDEQCQEWVFNNNFRVTMELVPAHLAVNVKTTTDMDGNKVYTL